MCKIIFIGATEQIDERPWDEQNPTFYLQQPTEEEKAVLKNFSKPYVYRVGTHRGCSCDFISYSNIPDEEYRSERLALASVIEHQLKKGNEVEVYCCWAGDYAADPEERTQKLFVPNLQGFYIDEKELVVYSGMA
jgi:hypothetical protein